MAAVIGVLVGAYAIFLIYVSIGSDRTLAKNIRIATDWTEIVAKPAVSAHRRHQNVPNRRY